MSPFDFDVVTGPSGKRPSEPEPCEPDDGSARPGAAAERGIAR